MCKEENCDKPAKFNLPIIRDKQEWESRLAKLKERI